MPDNIEAIGNAEVVKLLGEIKGVLSDIDISVKSGGVGAAEGEEGSQSTPPNSSITPAGKSNDMFKLASAGLSKLSSSLEKKRSKQEQEDGISRPPKAIERSAEKGAQFFSKAGSDYVPRAKAVVDTVSKAGAKYGAIATELNSIGEMQGISGASGDVTIPGTDIGFRSPFNPALVEGLKFKLSALKTGWRGGITTGQAEELGKATLGLGYNQGTSGFNSVFSGLVELNKSIGAGFASDPLVHEMLDKSVRYGSNSVRDFTDAMKDLVPAARAAHVNVNQMMNDVNQFGDLSRQTGGTFLNGVKTMTAMTLTTGVPALAINRLQNNGLVQANLMRGGNLNPWQLGLATYAQRNNAMYQTIDMLYNQMGPAPKDTVSRDPVTGLKVTQFGQDKRDADVAYMLGIDTADLQKMRRTEEISKKRAAVESGFQAYSQNASQLAKTNPNALKALITSQGGSNSGLVKAMQASGLDTKQINEVLAAGPHGPNLTASQMVKRAYAQKHKYEEILGNQEQEENVPQGNNVVTIRLSDASRRYLEIDGDPSGETKVTVGSGGARTASRGHAPPYRRTGKTTGGSS